MAVRATAIVLKAYQAGSLPPAVVAVKSLSGCSKPPSLDELKEVLNMQHMVRCIEYLYFNAEDSYDYLFGYQHYKYPPQRRRFPACLKENIPGAQNATIDGFQDSFFRAMYRLLLAGALLARAYMGPVFRARDERKARFFAIWGNDHYWSEDIENLEDMGYPNQFASELDIAFLRQYPVYNFDVSDWSSEGQWRNREYETCFGPFASWIIEDGRMRERKARQDPNEPIPDWAEERADVGAVRELMLLLVTYDHFNDSFGDGWTSAVPYLPKQGDRAVSIVRFGIFKAEQIIMPAAVEDVSLGRHPHGVVAQDHPALIGTAGSEIKDQIVIEKIMFNLKLESFSRTPIPWHKRHPGPPGELELWHFALRHYLNLSFKSGTFWMPKDHCDTIWWKEVGRGDVFMNPKWNIVQKYEPGVISWDWRNS